MPTLALADLKPASRTREAVHRHARRELSDGEAGGGLSPCECGRLPFQKVQCLMCWAEVLVEIETKAGKKREKK